LNTKVKIESVRFSHLLEVIVLFIGIIFPLLSVTYYVHLVILSFLWSIVAVCWNLLLGYSGISSFGNLVFFGVGAYSSAWLTINMGVPPWLGIFIGGLLASFMSILMGALTFRLRGVYVALFTFASQEMLRYIVLLPEATKWTGGPIGLLGVPGFKLSNFNSLYLNYYLAFGILLITILSIHKLLNSRTGLALNAMAQSEIYAKTLGINIFKTRLIVFSIAAFFTGIAGSFFAYYLHVVTDEYLSFTTMVSIIFMILIGGLGTFYGPVAGAFIYTIFSEYLKGILSGAIRLIVISMAIMIITILFPSGILEAIRKPFRSALKPKVRSLFKSANDTKSKAKNI